jgi:S1-C subfamily serine protease/regulation of enolase protein 1 (concanavalin A-like superfamily)
MPSRFVCPHCGASGRLPDGFKGDRIRCPACKSISQIGTAGAGSTQSGPAPSQTGPGGAARAEETEAVYALEPWEQADETPATPVVTERPGPAARPAPAPSRRPGDDEPEAEDEESSGPPMAMIIGGAAAGVVALLAGLLFMHPRGKSTPPRRSQASNQPVETPVAGRLGMPPQPVAPVPGQMNTSVNVPKLPGAPPPVVIGGPGSAPAIAAVAPGPAPAPVPGGPAQPATILPTNGPGATHAVAEAGNTQAAATDDTVRSIQDATVFLNVAVGRVKGSGTGFVIQSQGDTVLIATNDHVVNPHLIGLPRDDETSRPMQPTIHAVFRSGGGPAVEQTVLARILAADGEENRDLAILQCQGVKNPPQPISLDDVAEPKRLMPVIVYGFPFGPIERRFDPSVRRNPSLTVNRGAVSNLIKDQFDRLSRVQLDASINPGNSGGPVSDDKGRLVGVCVAKIEYTNIGFAIPAAEVSRLLAGRVGAISLRIRGPQDRQPLIEARARLIDPLNHVQDIHLVVAPAASTAGGPDADGNWPALTGAQTVQLNRAALIPTTSFRLEFPMPKDRRLLVQTIYRLDAGKIVRTMPTPKAVGRNGDWPPFDVPGPRFTALGPLVDARGQAVKDCNVQRTPDSLTIEVPAGVRLLSLQLDVHNAPMMLADVEGDFIAQVRVTGNMIPGTTPPKWKKPLPGTFQGAGLLLFVDSRNYVRMERSVAADKGKAALKSQALIEIIKGGRAIASLYPTIPGGPLYIRIQRIGGAVSCLFGPDGRRWLSHEKLAIAFPPKVKIGLIACNMSKVPLTAQFEEFVLITEQNEIDAKKSP